MDTRLRAPGSRLFWEPRHPHQAGRRGGGRRGCPASGGRGASRPRRARLQPLEGTGRSPGLPLDQTRPGPTQGPGFGREQLCRGKTALLLAGADSYLHLRSDRAAIVDAVHRTIAGESIWAVPEGTEPTAMLLGDPGGARLTSRELEVLTLKLHRRT